MILPVTEVDSIRHIQKAHTSHITAFESIFDKVERKEKECKERKKKQREKEKKDAIDRKRKNEQKEHRKREEARRVLEEQRRAAEQAVRIEQERAAEAAKDRTDQTVQNEGHEDQSTSSGSVRTSNGYIGSTWAEVSPEAAANYMAAHTGVPASVWSGVIFRESSNNPYALNNLGCFGYLQIMQSVHGQVSTWSPQAYLDKAIEIYRSQGAQAWEAW